MTIAHDTLTLDEFLELPEEKPALEFVDGRITQKAWPGGRHSMLQTTLAARINQYARPRRLGVAFIELQSVFDGSCIVPDLSVYRWARIPFEPNGEVGDEMLIAPDAVIDISSPDQSANAQIERCVWYVNHQIEVALLVDPDGGSVVAFRSSAQPVALHGADRIDLDEVLPGFELTVDELFAALMLE
ncbi:MAG: Uma2 family endonuclease [Dehalococcoidia bacterium]